MCASVFTFISSKFNLKNAIAPTLVVTGIFFLNYFFFGLENTVIGPCIALSYLYFSKISNRMASITKTFLIYMAVAVSAWLAGMNLTLCITINIGVFFWIAFVLIDEYHPDNYYTPGIAFLMFQLSPITGNGIVTRCTALALSFFLAFLIMWMTSFFFRKKLVQEYVEDGLNIGRKLLNVYEAGETEQVSRLQQELRQISETISDEIYQYNYAAFKNKHRVNWYCRFVALFQVFINLTSDENVEEKAPIMRNMLQNFSQLLSKNMEFAERKLLTLKQNKTDLHSFRLRFALRMVIIMIPCIIFAYLCPYGNGYWLGVSVYFMLVPLYEQSGFRIRGRVFGTLSGTLICLILYTVFPEQGQHVIIMTIANLFINSSTSYTATVAYLTCAVLALNITTQNLLFTLGERLVYTVCGAFLTMIASRYIFPIRVQPEAEHLKQKLAEIQTELAAVQSSSQPHTEETHRQNDQLLIRSYLLGRRLREYQQAMAEDSTDLLPLMEEHMKNVSCYFTYHFTGIKATLRTDSQSSKQLQARYTI